MCHNILKECPGLESLTTGSTGPWHSASGPEVVTCTLRVLNPRLAASPTTLFLRESNSFVSRVARKCLERSVWTQQMSTEEHGIGFGSVSSISLNR